MTGLVAWVSPEQLAALKDRPAGEGGDYLPTRLTRDGLFTQPLYAIPQHAPAIDLGQFRNAVEAEYQIACASHSTGITHSTVLMAAVKKRQRLMALIDGQAGAVARPTLSAIERQAIDGLLDVALQAWWATDDAADDVIGQEGTKRLSSALDKLDQLPDDQPGYVMEVAAKARWALHRLIAGQATLQASLNEPFGNSEELPAIDLEQFRDLAHRLHAYPEDAEAVSQELLALIDGQAASAFKCIGDALRCMDGNGCECQMLGLQPAKGEGVAGG